MRESLDRDLQRNLINELENKLLVWICLEKKKLKNKRGNVSMKFEHGLKKNNNKIKKEKRKEKYMYLSKQSTNSLLNLFSCSFFALFSFVFFIFWHNVIIILYIVEVRDEFHMNLALT